MSLANFLSIIICLPLFAASVSAQVIQNADTRTETEHAQKPKRYINPLPIESAGRLADPAVVRFGEKYYLYLTGGLAWSSEDLAEWEYHPVEMPEGVRITAPGAFVHQGYVYLTGNYAGLYRSQNPLGPFEFYGDFMDAKGQRLERGSCEGCNNGGVFDPMIFVDDDGRVYLYYAGRSVNGIYGVELDRENLTKILGPVHHFFKFDPSHVWERYGNHNENVSTSWVEGPWMTKHNGTYYLQYVAPGTDMPTYAIGVYTGKSPLGPFTYYEGSPIIADRGGLINGTGHHSVIEAKDGTVWAIYTLLYRNWNRMFERRIGMDPVSFDADGNMFINGPTEIPQWAPGVVAEPWRNNDSGVIPVTEDKNYEVSSEAPGRDAAYAIDRNVRTWWAPAPGDDAPSMTLDLASATTMDPIQTYVIDSARILFTLPSGLRREGEAARNRQYKIEVSTTGDEFTMVVDKTQNTLDNAVDFDEIEPIQCRFVRLTLTGWPEGLPVGVLEFTVFGEPGTAFPPLQD